MHRSQIILKEDQYTYLVNQARREGTSISEIVRELIDEHIVRTRDLKNDPFFDIIGMLEGDGEPIGRSIDRIVYGLEPTEEPAEDEE